jgi:hypothetical protein
LLDAVPQTETAIAAAQEELAGLHQNLADADQAIAAFVIVPENMVWCT